MTTILSKFTVEEIYLIKTCKTVNKTENIQEMKEYLKFVYSEMAEIVRNAIDKLCKATDKEYLDIRNYPAL